MFLQNCSQPIKKLYKNLQVALSLGSDLSPPKRQPSLCGAYKVSSAQYQLVVEKMKVHQGIM